MTKHTPGPWEVGKRNEDDNTLDIVWESGTTSYNKKQNVALVSPLGEYSTGFQEANARLIAAAPELLAAVKSMFLFIESYGGEVTKNFAGIKGKNLKYYSDLISKAEVK